MKARIKWMEGAAFVGESGSGHSVVMDGAPEHGGRNIGPRPMEMLLLGLGGCTAFDVVSILQKARQRIGVCEVSLDAERADAPPKVFTQIHIHFRLQGSELSEKQVQRAISLSAEKYCSASIMLGQSARITHDFELVEEV